jgi:hypothetical protein
MTQHLNASRQLDRRRRILFSKLDSFSYTNEKVLEQLNTLLNSRIPTRPLLIYTDYTLTEARSCRYPRQQICPAPLADL